MKKEAEIITDTNLISFCGLYCGACPRYLKQKCTGCKTTVKSLWCKVKPCNIENDLKSCAECKKYSSVSDCRKFNPLLIRFGEFISKTSRKDGLKMLKDKGPEMFAEHMAKSRLVSIKK